MPRDMAGLVEALTAFRARTGRGSRTNILPLCLSLLQSARPYGGGVVLPLVMFQPERPHGTRRPRASPAHDPHPCSNPRARRGRDVDVLQHAVVAHVSTRAPARGATEISVEDTDARWMFQPTRPHRVRRWLAACRRSRSWCFNPRARTGRDPSRPCERSSTDCVSTHAPAQGAT